MNKITITFFIVISGLTVGACYKEYTEDFSQEELIVQNAAIGQNEADDALDVVYECEVFFKINLNDSIVYDTINFGDCFKVYDDAVNRVFTVDFGSGPLCTSFFGRTRTGKITVAYEGAIGDTLSNRILTFDNYVVNNKQVEGTVSLQNMILNEKSLPQADRVLTDFKVTFPNGSAMVYNGFHTRVWTSGAGDTLEYNNTYFLFGSTEGTSSTGRAFKQDINPDSPVIVNFFCASSGGFPRTAGQVTMPTLEGYPDRLRSVVYGDTLCDKTIQVTTFRRSYGVATD